MVISNHDCAHVQEHSKQCMSSRTPQLCTLDVMYEIQHKMNDCSVGRKRGYAD